MTAKTKITNRFMSVLLCIALLMTYFPVSMLTATAADISDTRVSDPSTMDSWKNFFPTDELSTENAGGVWTDKSVFTNADAFAGTGITMKDENNSFLVALSAIASNMTVTGMSNVPTDSILILDVSGSMNDNSGNNDVAEELVEAANESIKSLLESNKYNRVGVVLYSGPTTVGGATSANDAVLVLPLGRYTTGSDGQYLNYRRTGSGNNTTETVRLDSDVIYEGTENKPTARQKEVVGATYIQKGLISAVQQFLDEDNTVTAEDPVAGTLQRKPVVVLMSDGAPTVGSTSFTAPAAINLGDGSDTSAALGFVTQLSAAYAKQQIEAKYGTDCLFYTLGLGVGNDSVATSVLNPARSSNAIKDFWTSYNRAAVGGTVSVSGRGQNARTVTKISETLEQTYVDKYFSVDASSSDLAQGLKDAFKDIVGTIQLQSQYFPTLISESEDLSGYLSFVDKIGEYMNVTDVKGILIHNTLFSGADLASNFVTGGGLLGTYDEPTELGKEMVAAVRARLGLDSDDTARTLIGLAYQYGQISYRSDTDFSNYIGWYANAEGEFLGFYHEGVTVLPAATGNAATDPAFTIKSYGYLGEVDEAHGVTESDMMYATVQVRENITTGEQTVAFAIPAALIPIITYNVTLDENGDLTDITASGAQQPMRLVYEVALKEGINQYTVNDMVSAEYLAENTNDDGSVNFYSNQWMPLVTEGPYNATTTNTYAYFNPSKQNDRYYYLEDTPVLVKDGAGNYQAYNEAEQPAGEKYYGYEVYKKAENGTLSIETVYMQISQEVLDKVKRNGDDGIWYIPAGSVHVNLHQAYDIFKGGHSTYVAKDNVTGTINYAHYPVVDTRRYIETGDGFNYYVSGVLGNNGKITVTPATGIKLTKSLADGATATDEKFEFVLTNKTNVSDNNAYNAMLISANGTETATTVSFNSGVAKVQLAAGETLYIGGMTANDVIEIKETETAEYILQSVNIDGAVSTVPANVTVAANKLAEVDFVNADRGKGNLTVAKEVAHDFGDDYQIPADKTFNITVTLSGVGTANATFEAKQTNSDITSITTDGNGQITVALKHDEQFEIFGLPEGTTATVVETEYGTGFTPAYWDNGVIGDGQVTVIRNSTVSVIVVNDYEATEVYPVNLELGGEKVVKNADNEIVSDWDADWEFTIVLERYGANGWDEVDRKTVNAQNKAFSFDMSKEVYAAPGVYSYQLYEVEPDIDAADRVDGMIYDIVWHTFSVYVSDADMDGQLEIVRVHSDHANKDFELVGGRYTIKADFENIQTVTVPALATVDIQKVLTNESGSPLVSLAGYNFGLYTDVNCTTAATVGDGIQTISLNPTDAVGEGWIDIQFNESGEYIFYVKEIAGSINNMSYSTNVIKVVVDVDIHAENANALVADVSYFNADGSAYTLNSDGEVEFINEYDPTDAELPINFVSKEISGRDMNSNDNFTFEVQLQDGTTVLTGSNNGTRTVTFNGTLKFSKVGTYFYNIVETSTDGSGITTDKTTYRIVVTVTDANGELKASYVLLNAVGDSIVFQNTYTADDVTYAIGGNKTLKGRVLLNDEFTFVMTEAADADGTVKDNAKSYETLNFIDGSFIFPEITYTEAGTYYYVVAEKANGGSSYGITYDKTEFVVTVVITDNGNGNLIVSEVDYKVKGNGDVNSIAFVNEYVPNPTSAQIPGNKTLEGKVLDGGDFSFELYNSDANWVEGTKLETVQNAKDGTFSFTAIEYDKAGVYYYLVKEVNGGKTIDGVTYDDTVFRVRIEITDDLKGQLHSEIYVYDNYNIPQESVIFINSYEIIGGSSVELEGKKTLNGRDMVDGEFTFELYETDETFEVSGNADRIAVNTDGKFGFTLDYSAGDVGKTFYYVVKEKNAGATADGVSYSTLEYRITVVVEDNGKGGIKTTAAIKKNGEDAAILDFVNEYKADKTTVDFEGHKTLTGIRELQENDFIFDLYNADETFAIDGAVVQSVKNKADGTFKFANVELTEAKTYRFIIKENSENPIGGVTYDTAVYNITVIVKDDGKGKLYVDETIIIRVKGEISEIVTEIAFENSYKTTDATVTISGEKVLNGRTLTEGEFAFLMYPANSEFAIDANAQPIKAVNKADGTFTFDAQTFSEAKTYYFVISEDDTVNADRITFDKSVYHVSIEVIDSGNGKLVASSPVIVKNGSSEIAEAIRFENTYTPKPSDISIDITAHKTVVNKGSESIGPEDFEFLLENTTNGDRLSVKSNTAGNAVFTLTFSEDDIGKTYTYKLTEINGAKENVQYSTAEYAITVTVSLDADNNLIAVLTLNEAEVTSVVAEFENVYDYTPTPPDDPDDPDNPDDPDVPDNPQTGDNTNLGLWFALLFISGGAIITLTVYDRKGRKAF